MLVHKFSRAKGVEFMVDAKDLERREFYFEFRGDCRFVISESVSIKVGNNVCVWEGANMWVEVLVPIWIGGCNYGYCVGILFSRKAGPMESLLEVCSRMGVGISNALPFMVKCRPKKSKNFVPGEWGVELSKL
ncbi:hypothetical protein KC19_VG068900 [Ceratodon purpureus]|uniref:Uncharacterized protein n=1 Tax=Ceratodon purpureus TaxID=3225 RepID=A0A8T0HMU4_CERPU|nr:hypothetical protein KC19_VG068900 [Ceratodon purpureus]